MGGPSKGTGINLSTLSLVLNACCGIGIMIKTGALFANADPAYASYSHERCFSMKAKMLCLIAADRLPDTDLTCWVRADWSQVNLLR